MYKSRLEYYLPDLPQPPKLSSSECAAQIADAIHILNYSYLAAEIGFSRLMDIEHTLEDMINGLKAPEPQIPSAAKLLEVLLNVSAEVEAAQVLLCHSKFIKQGKLMAGLTQSIGKLIDLPRGEGYIPQTDCDS